MNEHYIVTADHAHVRIFRQQQPRGQLTASLEEVQALDFPAGKRSYTDRDTDMAGRFQRSGGPGTPAARAGMSIDERLPMEREEERRLARDISDAIETFLQFRPEATWDFAAGPETQNAVLDGLKRKTRDRLNRTVAKNLVKQPLEEVRALFASSVPHRAREL